MTKLNEKFRLQNVLGVGAYAEVRCASVIGRSRSHPGKYCAIKIVDQRVVPRAQFEFEQSILPELSHPNVIGISEVIESTLHSNYCTECGCTDFTPGQRGSCANCPHGLDCHCKLREARAVTLIVQELCAAGDLFCLIVRSGQFPEDLSRMYFKQLVAGVEFLHLNGILHRDIKPENICFDADFNLKLIDFGSATFIHELDFLDFEPLDDDDHNRKVGTKEYSAPEISILHGPGCCASDIWSCGVILYILLMGKPAWRLPVLEGANRDPYFQKVMNGRFSPKLPPKVTSLLSKIWRIQPVDRISLEEIKKHPFWSGAVPSKKSKDRQMLERARMAWIGEGLPDMIRVLTHQRSRRQRRDSEPGVPKVPKGEKDKSKDASQSPRFTNHERITIAINSKDSESFLPVPAETIAVKRSSPTSKKKPPPDRPPLLPEVPLPILLNAHPEGHEAKDCYREENNHVTTSKKIIARLTLWNPHLKITREVRTKTSRLVVECDQPVFEALIRVNKLQGEIVSLRGKGADDVEDDLEAAVRLKTPS